MSKYMTKVQAENNFREIYYNALSLEDKKDKVAVRTEWNDYTDFLCKDGKISESQYMNWCHPNFCK